MTFNFFMAQGASRRAPYRRSALSTLGRATTQDSDRGPFVQLVNKGFPILMTELAPHSSKPPADVLYDVYRNGLVHGLGPKGKFALCRNNEVAGSYVAAVHVPNAGERIGLNVDRLTSDFLALVKRRQRAAV
jgi:hypothetical protein